jgi:hypothetical protein
VRGDRAPVALGDDTRDRREGLVPLVRRGRAVEEQERMHRAVEEIEEPLRPRSLRRSTSGARSPAEGAALKSSRSLVLGHSLFRAICARYYGIATG